MKSYRALWLMNHNTLRPFEVPMLLDMGFEIYCPKMYPYDEGNLSASIDYQYDSSLTIPEEVLALLNQVDFYKQVPADIMGLINQYFDIAFIGFFPEQLKMLVEGFKGVIVMQAFGLSNGVTYSNVIEEYLGISFLEKLESLEERFFFAEAYENIAEIECRYLRNRSIYLPLGLKNAYVQDKWVGGEQKILFVCPRINTSPYFNNIYRKFKKDFQGFDYIIGGAQPIEVTNDRRVAGYIPKDQYEYNMTHLAVMFYHSQEKRHLHYHPLEAVKQGMPLVFMEGGLLEQIAGKKLPGSCKTVREARKKISRIMKGDQQLIRKIKASQSVLLKPFQYDFCREQWEKEFDKVYSVLSKETQKKQKDRKKIGILLTEGYTGGVLDYTLRFTKSLIRGIRENQDKVDIVFGYIDHENFAKKDYFADFREEKVQIRQFSWKIVDQEYLNTIMKFKGWEKRYQTGMYCIPDDGANYFEDCDFLILSVDRVPFDFFTLKPYIVVVHDYVQRYMPEQYGGFYEKSVIDLQRKAEAVIVMTQPTLEDGIQYGGLKKEKLRLTPLMFDNISVPDKQVSQLPKEFYFLWSTNVGKHKNHKKALEALSQYYLEGGKLKCYITGVDTKKFDITEKYDKEGDYISEVREIIKGDSLLKKNLKFCGNMPKNQYYAVLQNAKFVMHPGFTDNGNMTAIDAAFLKVPTITSDYPAMRYYEETMHLNMKFFDPFNSKELKNLLFYMEENHADLSNRLPSSEELEKYTIRHTYIQIYNTVKDVFKFE